MCNTTAHVVKGYEGRTIPKPEQLQAAKERIAQLITHDYSPEEAYGYLDDILVLIADEPYNGGIDHGLPAMYRFVRELRDVLGFQLLIHN